MFSHHNMSDDTEIINSDLNSNNDASNAETNEKNEIKNLETELDNNSLNEIENNLEDNDENNIESSDVENLEKMILSTGIRVGTPVKTKSMSRYIVRPNPEGLYILDISKTL